MTTPPPDPNTAVFPGFFLVFFFVAGVHLYFTLGGFHFPAALPIASGLPLSLLLTSLLVNIAVNTKLIHS